MLNYCPPHLVLHCPEFPPCCLPAGQHFRWNIHRPATRFLIADEVDLRQFIRVYDYSHFVSPSVLVYRLDHCRLRGQSPSFLCLSFPCLGQNLRVHPAAQSVAVAVGYRDRLRPPCSFWPQFEPVPCSLAVAGDDRDDDSFVPVRPERTIERRIRHSAHRFV